MAVGVRTGVLRARSRRARSRVLWRGAIAAALLVASVAALVGVMYAGSPARLAEGTRIGGVDVGGMTPGAAVALLERRASALERVPVTFYAGDDRWQITPRRLGVEADWAAAVDAAQRAGEGFAPLRGLKRARVRVFGSDIAPPAKVYEPALAFQLREFARELDERRREAAIVLRGLKPIVVPGQAAQRLDHERAAATVVGALAALSRAPTPLPVHVQEPAVTPDELESALEQTQLALSAPIRLTLGETRWRLRPRVIAQLLALPRDGRTTVEIGGAGARAWFTKFSRAVGRPPVNALFSVSGGGNVTVIPHKQGLVLDVEATSRSIRTAALSPTRRVGAVTVNSQTPERTTSEAKAMGITRVLASYTTAYSGTADRIHNLQLAVSLIDSTLIPPGGTFSLNETVGERTAERGFRMAPVIIGGEYKESIGGGVSQVATTVFNAAWEAGLKILERAPHSLYISRYPTGRDATVNYPDLDLKFRNDTERWLLVIGSAGSGGITVTLAGAPTGRRVVSEAGPLVVTGTGPEKRMLDPTLPAGQTVVEEAGSPARAVTVTRKVYGEDGALLYDEVWRTSYRGDKRVIRVGTKPVPKPEPADKPADEPEAKPKPPPKAPPPEEPVIP